MANFGCAERCPVFWVRKKPRYNRGEMKVPQKPVVFGDVVPASAARATANEPEYLKHKKQWTAFDRLPLRVNLAARTNEKIIRLRLTRWSRFAVGLGAALFMILGSASAPTFFTKASGGTTTTLDASAERNDLQNQLEQLQSQIDQYEGQISTYERQGKTLNGEISQLNAKIAKLNLQIKATTLTIAQLDKEIADTQSQIGTTEAEIKAKQASIQGLMNSIYKNDHVSLVEAFLKNPRLSDFWSDSTNIVLLQNNLRATVAQVTDLQNQLQDQKQQFEASKADAATAAEYQKSQVAEIATTKGQKSELLAATKGQESKYQVLLQKTQATAAQIRDRIFQLLGGGQLSFEDAYQYAKLASGATGIDPAFILAILDRESALGQNVGRCSYKTAMSPANQPLFLALTQSLGLNPDQILVSCPNRDGLYGGAMGPAQFVPSTWNLYAGGISAITGHSTPSPWNNADAFAATALYLKDGMTACKSVYDATTAIERCTAARYYAGSRWKSYLWTYGEAVVERANGFAADIQTITTS